MKRPPARLLRCACYTQHRVEGIGWTSHARLARGFYQAIFLVAFLAVPRCDLVAFESVETYPHSTWTVFGSVGARKPQAITQDADGYIWLGFNGGLVRFDGHDFVEWNELSDAPLLEQDVTALYAARDGSLWVGHGHLGGVSKIRHGAVRHYATNDGVPRGSIRTLFEDQSGTIWVGSHGVARFRHDRWEQLNQHGLPDASIVFEFHQDDAGTVWLGSRQGLFRFDAENESFERISSISSPVHDIASDLSGDVWITDPKHAYRRIASSSQPTPMPDGALSAWGDLLLRDQRGHLWISVRQKGLWHVGDSVWSGKGTIEWHNRRNGLTGDLVVSLFEDRDGGIWVATDRGLDRFAHGNPYEVQTHPTLVGQRVRVVAAARDGTMWTGTDDGLYHLSDEGSRWYREDDGLPGSVIDALHEDPDGNIWVATDQGVVRFADGRFVTPLIPGKKQPKRILAITTDGNGRLWICAASGLYLWRQGVLTDFGDVPQLQGRVPLVVYNDSRNTVWVGFASGGVATFDGAEFHRLYGTQDGLIKGRVTAIFEDNEGLVWIGTVDGLSKLVHGQIVTVASGNEVLPHGVLAITQDESGNMWLATQAGLMRFTSSEFERALGDPSYSMHRRAFHAPTGMENAPYWGGQPSVAHTVNGELWFVTEGGVAVVNPQRLRPPPGPPQVSLSRALVDGERVFVSPHVELPAATTRLQIRYSALSFEATDRLRFRYMLDGVDSEWIEGDASRQALYTNLSPGSYRFRVVASYDGASWTTPAQAWAFSVAPMFYQTGWFFITIAVSASLLSFGLWRSHLRHVDQQHALVLAERSRVARELHDTLLGDMAGVALEIQTIADTRAASTSQVDACLRRAAATLQHCIREARDSIRDLREVNLREHSLPVLVRHAGERITANTGIAFTLTAEGASTVCPVHMKRTLLLIARESILNATQHADADEISAVLSFDSERVRLQVSDNGHGYDSKVTQLPVADHWGLALMRGRAEQLGGTFSLTSSMIGTKVEVAVPLVTANIV